ncbi:hypothetical protein [Elizabethkingia meningoseptica]|uniref:hypothetical protein n=1 Tax=Elizabethkingia meningoseptica TaxID=238 RepID=UPI00389241E8
MKRLLLSLLFLSVSVTAQKTIFNIKYSEQLAVFVFIQNLSENYPENIYIWLMDK